MARNILFVTKGNKDYEEGFQYAAELSCIRRTGISVLMIYDKSPLKSFIDNMAAVAFAEAGEAETANDISSEWLRKIDAETKMRTNSLIRKYCREKESLDVSYRAGTGDIASHIKKSLKSDPSIDMVLISPCISEKGVLNVKRYLKDISRPVVTMSKLADAGA